MPTKPGPPPRKRKSTKGLPPQPTEARTYSPEDRDGDVDTDRLQVKVATLQAEVTRLAAANEEKDRSLESTRQEIEKLYQAEQNNTAVSIEGVVRLEIAKLESYDRNHRKYFDEERLASLTQSVRQKGLLVPPIVRPITEGRWQVISGERRFRAAKNAGLLEIPCRVYNFTDEEALEVSLADNFLRDDPNPYERTVGLLELLSQKLDMPPDAVVALFKQMRSVREAARQRGEDLNNVIQDPRAKLAGEVVSEVGGISWNSFLQNNIPVLKAHDDILTALDRGDLPYNNAMVVNKVVDSQERMELLGRAISDRMSVADLRKQVALINKRVSEPNQSNAVDAIKTLSSARKSFTRRRGKFVKLGSAAEELVEKIENRFRDLDRVGDEILTLLAELEDIR